MRTVAAVCIALFLYFVPVPLFAIPFGGPVLPFLCPMNLPGVCSCYNYANYAVLGPPRGGPFVWTLASRMHEAGPPGRIGQYALGLASVPYYCVASVFPVIVYPGLHVDMFGTSGPGAERPKTTNATSTPVQWRYPYYTHAGEYDAEIDRLDAEQEKCRLKGITYCPYYDLSLSLREERVARFGPRI